MSQPSKKIFIPIMTALTLVVGLVVFLTQLGTTMRKQRNSPRLQPSEQTLLNQLDEQGIRYFIENQLPNGLVLDRQLNSGTPVLDNPVSTSATGMGLMAIAVASSPEHHMLTHAEAVKRVRNALETSLKLQNDHGIMPHFLDPDTLKPLNWDGYSTIDSGWLIAGGLWSAEYLDDPTLRSLAAQLEQRVDWQYWATQTKDGLQISMGSNLKTNQKLAVTYDRYNAEAAILYMLAIGANNGHQLPADTWFKLSTKDGVVAGIHVTNQDLGLFAFQYGGLLIDFSRMPLNGMPDLSREATKAAMANWGACRQASGQYKTFQQFWGLSAGDGPPDQPGQPDSYRIYSPWEMDGTAHITATLASIEQVPELVLENLRAAESNKRLVSHGRYGYSNINVDKNWVSQDVVGIDIGAAVMALENELYDGRMRTTWHKLPVMRRAMRRLKAVKKDNVIGVLGGAKHAA